MTRFSSEVSTLVGWVDIPHTCLMSHYRGRAELRRSVHRQSNGAPSDNRQQIIRMLSKAPSGSRHFENVHYSTRAHGSACFSCCRPPLLHILGSISCPGNLMYSSLYSKILGDLRCDVFFASKTSSHIKNSCVKREGINTCNDSMFLLHLTNLGFWHFRDLLYF